MVSFSNLLPAVITVVILIFILAFTTEFPNITNPDFQQASEMYQSTGLILTLHKFLLHILHVHY